MIRKPGRGVRSTTPGTLTLMSTDEEVQMSTKTTTKTTDRGGSVDRRGGNIGRVRTLIRDTMSEIRKVTWPDQQTTRNLTILVIVMATLLGALLGGIDAIFVRLWEAIPS
jgi:preprotein translocase subunit SecE